MAPEHFLVVGLAVAVAVACSGALNLWKRKLLLLILTILC